MSALGASLAFLIMRCSVSVSLSIVGSVIDIARSMGTTTATTTITYTTRGTLFDCVPCGAIQ